jgi:hypothetical protein
MRLKRIMILVMIMTTLICCNTQISSIASNTNKQVKIGVLLNNYYNPYNLSIKKGSNNIIQETKKIADAIYAVGMNLVSGNEPLKGINYKFDKTGVIVSIQYEGYITQNKVNNV